VDIVDIMLVAIRWGMTSSDPDWDPRYDLDNDGDVDMADIMLVATHWGKRCEVDKAELL
jgi:hypothetical protein